MPQMAPIWWTLMFLTFITSFMMIWMIMYFQHNPEPLKTILNNNLKSSFNWKW